jgi:DNA-binding response OmpR family regulator
MRQYGWREVGIDEGDVVKIYIVDDDEMIIGLMSELLRTAGHRVESNTVGELALSEIVAQRPDCVLVDLMMAAFDGLELCRELRQRKETRNLKIIMISARTAEHWKQQAGELDASYIEKPLDPETFAAQVEELAG